MLWELEVRVGNVSMAEDGAATRAAAVTAVGRRSMASEDRPPDGVDPTTPNAARIYDYFLGGTSSFAADREVAEQVLRAAPEVRSTLRANRSFLGRVVRYLAEEAGMDQFIDLGAGLPTQEN